MSLGDCTRVPLTCKQNLLFPSSCSYSEGVTCPSDSRSQSFRFRDRKCLKIFSRNEPRSFPRKLNVTSRRSSAREGVDADNSSPTSPTDMGTIASCVTASFGMWKERLHTALTSLLITKRACAERHASPSVFSLSASASLCVVESALDAMNTALSRTSLSVSFAANVPVSCALTITRAHPPPFSLEPLRRHVAASSAARRSTIALTFFVIASRPDSGYAATRSRYGRAGTRNAVASFGSAVKNGGSPIKCTM
mmetsp:Transcript_8831/g.37357  ORF Transcript_8831/g.37357 Transcript_8831/m.37357 type:complete len:252 (-) Transcript_8831:635-1390(-)